MLRAWRKADGFEGRSSVRSWLYRIATNVCIDMQRHVQRRARPMEMGPASPPDQSRLGPLLPEAPGCCPSPMPGSGRSTPTPPRSPSTASRSGWPSSPPSSTCRRASGRRSCCATSSGGRRPRRPSCSRPRSPQSTARSSGRGPRCAQEADVATGSLDDDDANSWAATSTRSSATTSTAWSHCCTTTRCSRCPRWRSGSGGRPTSAPGWSSPAPTSPGVSPAPRPGQGCPAFGQYRRDPAGGFEPWALQVLEVSGGRIASMSMFLAPLAPWPPVRRIRPAVAPRR